MNSIQKKQILKNRLSFLLVLLFIYVVLFEFILPFNKILPKPSLLLESLPALFEDYQLQTEMAITTTIIYLSIPVGYLILKVFSPVLSKVITMSPGVFNNFKLFKNFPAFFFAVLFAFWFDDSLFAELVFAVVASTFFLIVVYIEASQKVKQNYKDAAMSLLIVEKELHKKVVWKHTQPTIFSEMNRLHYYLWVLILIYEFIGGVNGFGSIYIYALDYQDFSAIVMLGIVVALLIWLGNSIIDYFHSRLVFWKV